jgi:hypothetical protein
MLLMMPVMPLEWNGYCRAAFVGIRSTGTAIAGEHVWHAFLHRPVSAIPISLASADLYDCAPRPVTRRMTGRRSKHRARGQAGADDRNFDCGSHYFASFCNLRFAAMLGAVLVGPVAGTDTVVGSIA